MTAKTGAYALATGAEAVRRLHVLHNIYSPAARRVLLQAGVKKGMRVADFGCGVGATTHMLSDMVGPVPSGGDADGTAIGATHNQQSRDTLYTGFGGGWRWRGFGNTGMATTTVRNIPVGRLIVDIFDGNSKQLVWRGIAADTLTGNPEKNEKNLGKSVTEMFKKFPPPSKG
jgi:Domain of unknown function (DUF4136)